MDEYIKREAAYREFCTDDTLSGYEKAYCCEIIKKIPAADVAPVRHWRWIDGDPYCPICRKDKFRGLDADVWSDWKPDHCPNCGCRMDLEE